MATAATRLVQEGVAQHPMSMSKITNYVAAA
jgi:hypothetical protein